MRTILLTEWILARNVSSRLERAKCNENDTFEVEFGKASFFEGSGFATREQ
jgi:hypothetical protein